MAATAQHKAPALRGAVEDDRLRELMQRHPLTLDDSTAVSPRRRRTGMKTGLEAMLPAEGQKPLSDDELNALLARRSDPKTRERLIEDGRLTAAEEVSAILPEIRESPRLQAADVFQDAMVAVVEAADSYRVGGQDGPFQEYRNGRVRAAIVSSVCGARGEDMLSESSGRVGEYAADANDPGVAARAHDLDFDGWLRKNAMFILEEGSRGVSSTGAQPRRFRMWMDGLDYAGIAEKEGVTGEAVRASIARAVKNVARSYRSHFTDY